jgi:oxalate decarboxylase
VPGGGAQWTATANEFPISTTLSVSVLEIAPGAMRELHWHPHADEWQYYLEGAAEVGVYLGMGHAVTEQFVTGDIGYVPMGAGHYIRNTGSGILRLLLGFNNGHYRAHDLSAWVASNTPDVLAANLGLPRAVAEALPKETLFIALPPVAR